MLKPIWSVIVAVGLIVTIQSAAAPATPVFSAPLTIATNVFSGEPGIAFDGSRIFIDAPSGNNSSVWRSDDGGTSFHALPTPLGNGGDSSLAVDGAGTVYMSELFPSASVSVSFNHGDSWAYKTSVAPPSLNDRQWIAAEGNGTAYLSWIDGDISAIAAGITHTSGANWASVEVTSTYSTAGPITIGADDNLYIPIATNDGIDVARSVNHGVQWKTFHVESGHTLNDTQLLFPVIASDTASNLYVTWAEAPSCTPVVAAFLCHPLPPGIFVSHSSDHGQTWSSPQRLSNPGHDAIFPWIVAGSSGRADIVWLEGVPPAGSAVGDINFAVGYEWFVMMAQSSAAMTNAPWQVAQVSPGPVHLGSICTHGTLCQFACFGVTGPGVFCPAEIPTVANDRRLLDFISVTRDGQGNALVTWTQDPPITNVQQTFVNQTVDIEFAHQIDGPRLFS
ncbi:MAG: WD40/YVTN/BNR-like repeat-containing protein [Thermoplasmatota archaeon]